MNMGPILKAIRLFQTRPLCTNNKPDKHTSITRNNGSDNSREVNGDEASLSISRQEAYKKLENLDFMSATKILFTTPPKGKKFGLDFHLVQLFFACLPSLAVYLVAQYARSEMKRMEAELEVKKKAEEEAKAKEMEPKAAEEQKDESDPQLLEVKRRLDRLEDAVKEIVIESKKKSSDSRENSQADKQPTIFKANGVGTDARHSTSSDHPGKEA